MTKKIGFWAVFALVTGSQIGSAVFMLPVSLAPYGAYSLIGWVISGIGAISLALVFAMLCARFPRTGGPHVYVGQAFGSTISFFTGWTYWVISWVSTSAVIIACIGYLSPFLPTDSSIKHLVWQILLLFGVTILNLKGAKAAGKVEFWLTFIKFVPLIIVPVITIFNFDISNFVVDASLENTKTSSILGHVVLLTLWGFIGLESATTSAGSVENASKTIPKAIVIGTISVAILYIINNVAIMGLIPNQELMHSKAPYADAVKQVFGGYGHILMSLIASIACLGTLNAWILTSGQIVLGLAEDGLMPKFFANKTFNGAPYWGLIISSLGIIPLLILTSNHEFAEQITTIIDISVITFLFVYLICCLALIKVLIIDFNKLFSLKILVCLMATGFCLWIIYETELFILATSSLFIISGLPIYFLNRIKTFKHLL